MNLTNAIPQDELLLAQLTAAKVGKVIQGILSVGLGALQLELPTDFLGDKDQVLLAFVGVLQSVGVRPDQVDGGLLLRRYADRLSVLARQFHKYFLQLASWRTMSPQEVRNVVEHLLASYAAFCQELGAFQALLGVTDDHSGQTQQARIMVNAFLKDCLTPTAGNVEAGS